MFLKEMLNTHSLINLLNSMAFQFEGKVMTEENFDHLETVYINLHFPVTTPTVIANKASNSPFKARSYNSLYEGLSEANQRAIAELVLSVDTSTETCLLYTSPSPRDGLLSRMPSSA